MPTTLAVSTRGFVLWCFRKIFITCDQGWLHNRLTRSKKHSLRIQYLLLSNFMTALQTGNLCLPKTWCSSVSQPRNENPTYFRNRQTRTLELRQRNFTNVKPTFHMKATKLHCVACAAQLTSVMRMKSENTQSQKVARQQHLLCQQEALCFGAPVTYSSHVIKGRSTTG